MYFLCLSDTIKDEVINFLRARTDSNVLAKQCYMRLVKMITHGRRTYPPHIAEVQAIQVNTFIIYLKLCMKWCYCIIQIPVKTHQKFLSRVLSHVFISNKYIHA